MSFGKVGSSKARLRGADCHWWWNEGNGELYTSWKQTLHRFTICVVTYNGKVGNGTLRLKKREGEMVVWCGTRGQPTEWSRDKWILPSASTVLSNLSIFNYILKKGENINKRKRENINKRKRGKYITCDCLYIYIYI